MGNTVRARVGSGALAAMAAAMLLGCAAADRVGDARESIIGGESSDPGAYPATGALLHGLAYRCTATLIAPDVAITAAHCLADGGFGDFGFTLDADLGDGMGHPIEVLATHQHPEFRETAEELTQMGQRNDVGVVILGEPIEGVAVEELDLGLDPGGAEGELESGSALTLCGYGRDDWGADGSSGVKREGVLHVDQVGDWELQTTDEGPQACRGDSGAPLFAGTADGRVIAGLVSRAAGDSHMCDSGGIHTRVAPYADWIAQASRDRDTGGCQVGGGGASGAGAAFALVAACALAMRGRRCRPRSSSPAPHARAPRPLARPRGGRVRDRAGMRQSRAAAQRARCRARSVCAAPASPTESAPGSSRGDGAIPRPAPTRAAGPAGTSSPIG
jgi:hypothetical protein